MNPKWQASRLHSHRFLLFLEISISQYQWNLFKHKSTYKPQILLPWNKQLPPCFPNSKPSSRLFQFCKFSWPRLEFIWAQAPLRLKGLLIGIWYASLAGGHVLQPVESASIFSGKKVTWEVLHEVKAFLIFLSLILFLCVVSLSSMRRGGEWVAVTGVVLIDTIT